MHTNQPTPDPHLDQQPSSSSLWLYFATQWRRVFGLNISRINPLLFVGGEFTAAQWPAIYALGVRAVLNLQAERADQFIGPLPTRTLRIEVEDFHAPTIAQLHAAIAFMGAAHAEQLPVLVHCHAGVGRASLTASAYLMSLGMSRSVAFGSIQRARPIVALGNTQLDRLIEWEEVLCRGH